MTGGGGRVNLVKCRKCGILFPRERGDLCPACRELENEALDKVKNYLDYHPEATAEKVAEKTGVEVERILRFAREGALSSVENVNIRFPCEKCGEPISTGRFCKRCTDRLADDFKSAAERIRNAKGARER